MNYEDILRECYPKGTRIKLVLMPDNPATRPILPGSTGSVDHVDDAGQIQMQWDDGRSLAIIPEIDQFIVISRPSENLT